MVKYLDNNSGFNQWMANNKQTQKPKSRLASFLWWMVLFLFAWWVLGLWLQPKPVVSPDDAATPTVIDLSAVPTSEISSDKITATVQGLRISDIKLLDFAQGVSSDTPDARVALLAGDGDFAEMGFVATGTTAPTAATVWQKNGDSFVWHNNDGVQFTRTLSVNNYIITINDQIKNNTKRDIAFAPYARVVRTMSKSSTGGVYTGAVAYVNSDIEHQDWYRINKKTFAYSTTNGFIGFADQYWETLVDINHPDQTMRIKKVGDYYQADTSAGVLSVAAGDTKTITTNIYAGPREQQTLNAAAAVIHGANKTMDYGWFWFLSRPMLWILNALNALVMNYGLAIIILTILLRIAIWPLTRKSYTSMVAMQKMQPEMTRIQKLYANDKARMQMELMRLYQTHKTSPMSGCLPMLIQIPIFFALYKALLISVSMRSAHFLWISDLAVMDPYFILPILMGATMYLQQYLQSAKPAKSDGNDIAAQTQRAMKWMPLIFTVMFAWMPAGLVLYWTVSNLFGIFQMYIIKHNMK